MIPRTFNAAASQRITFNRPSYTASIPLSEVHTRKELDGLWTEL